MKITDERKRTKKKQKNKKQNKKQRQKRKKGDANCSESVDI